MSLNQFFYSLSLREILFGTSRADCYCWFKFFKSNVCLESLLYAFECLNIDCEEGDYLNIFRINQNACMLRNHILDSWAHQCLQIYRSINFQSQSNIQGQAFALTLLGTFFQLHPKKIKNQIYNPKNQIKKSEKYQGQTPPNKKSLIQTGIILGISILIKELILRTLQSNKMSFQQTQFAGASQFQFKQAGSIKKGDFCMIIDQPAKVIDLAVSKPGKHGSAKVCIMGINIFTDRKIQAIFSTSASVMVPVVKKYDLEVIDIDQENFVSFILPNNTLKEDLKLPESKEEAKKLRSVWQHNKDQNSILFTIIQALDQQRIIGVKMIKNN